MGRRVTQYVVLGVLLIVLALVLAYQFRQDSAPGAGPEAARSAVAGRPGGRKPEPPLSAVPDVRLAALGAAQAAQPAGSVRNPFQVKPKPAPPPPPPVNRGAGPGQSPDQPPAPPPPPPITLKFVGVVTPGGGAAKIAVLSGGGDVFYGREGDIIDGRYRIVSVGVESVVVAYVDGRGTRRIPLSGS